MNLLELPRIAICSRFRISQPNARAKLQKTYLQGVSCQIDYRVIVVLVRDLVDYHV